MKPLLKQDDLKNSVVIKQHPTYRFKNLKFLNVGYAPTKMPSANWRNLNGGKSILTRSTVTVPLFLYQNGTTARRIEQQKSGQNHENSYQIIS